MTFDQLFSASLDWSTPVRVCEILDGAERGIEEILLGTRNRKERLTAISSSIRTLLSEEKDVRVLAWFRARGVRRQWGRR